MSEPPAGPPPGFAVLLDWLEGRLDSAEATAVEEAVAAGDARSRATVAWLERFLAATRAPSAPEVPEVPEVPQIVRQNLRRAFEDRHGAGPKEQGPPRELTASLIFDSRRDLALVGMRGEGGLDDVFHLAWTTPEADLVLDVRRLGTSRARLDGQVLLAGEDTATVFEASARGAGFTERTVDGDELGRFSLASVPDHARELRVTNGELAITADLDIREG